MPWLQPPSNSNSARQGSAVSGREISPAKSPSRLFSTFLLSALFLVLPLVQASTAQAAPFIRGDLEAHFTVDQDDCSQCTEAELDELQEGLALLLTEMRLANRAPGGVLCVAHGGLARDLAVLTFGLYKSGDIDLARWQSYLRKLGEAAGVVKDPVRYAVLDGFLDTYAERLGPSITPDLVIRDQLRILTAIQLYRLFLYKGAGVWDSETWTQALQSTTDSYNSVIDALLSFKDPSRVQIDQTILTAQAHLIWSEAEMAPLTDLPADLQVCGVVAARDQLFADYELEIFRGQSDFMFHGCAGKAAEGFFFAAYHLSEPYRPMEFIARGGEGEGGPEHAGINPSNDATIDPEEPSTTGCNLLTCGLLWWWGPVGEEIDVVAEAPDRPVPPPAPGLPPLPTPPPPPFHPPNLPPAPYFPPLPTPPGPTPVDGGCDPYFENCAGQYNCGFGPNGSVPLGVECDDLSCDGLKVFCETLGFLIAGGAAAGNPVLRGLAVACYVARRQCDNF